MKKLNGLMTIALALAVASVATNANEAPAGACDDTCLTGIADAYLASLVAHDARKAPLATGAVIVENLAKIKAGEGLWKTASALPGAYKIVVPDAEAQQVAVLAVMSEEQGADGQKPIQIGLRLKIANRKIVEAEQIVVHKLEVRNLVNLDKPRTAFATSVPEAYRDSRARLLSIGGSYYDALDENNGRLAPFADDCVRLENGFQTARLPVPKDSNPRGMIGALGCAAQLDSQAMKYISRIENRRMFAANERLGLAVGLSHFRHDMKEKEYRVYGVPGAETWKMDFAPFDLPAMHIYKIYGGQIHEIEAVGYVAPYQSPTGWEK